MERNWLIRTSQNQILGPVAKQKLLEFIQKGALGLTDEVTSGNGYWFALKEKDLVDKYLHGDVPQSYNPISESKSVLAHRENPEKTSSINTAPVNNEKAIKLNLDVGIAPKEEDLAFPDITVVRNMPKLNLEANDTKLPDSSDLEFPDMDLIASSVNASFQNPAEEDGTRVITLPVTNTPKPAPVKAAPVASLSTEDAVFPADDDLAFPDMDSVKTSPKIDKGKVDLSHQYTRTVALDTEQAAEVLPLRVVEDELTLDAPKQYQEAPAAVQPVKKERPQVEDRKLLHDRKTKSSLTQTRSAAAQRDPNRELHHKETQSGPLKKRNDNYIFFILIIIVLIIVAIFFYFKEILNKPLPV